MRGINNYSFLFNNYSDDKKTNLINSFNFTDLASINNGSYKRLVQKQLADTKVADDTTAKKNYTKTDITANTSNKLRSSVESLGKSVDALNDKGLWTQKDGSYDTEKITKAIKSFALSYNGVVEQAANSNSTSVASSARWMNSLTDTMKTSLEKVGVKLGDDNKLSVDEDTLAKADMKSVKTMFSGAYSYANQTVEKARSVASASLRDMSMYTNTGSYANMMSSWFNTSV